MIKRFALELAMVNVGDVVFLRRNGKVIGARYKGCKSVPNASVHITKHLFERADGVSENLYVSPSELKAVYPTIEDAIHDTSHISYRRVDIAELLKERFGFFIEYGPFGTSFVTKKYKWDGYRPKEILDTHYNYTVVYDGEWRLERNKNLKEKVYDSYDECIADNVVDVVTF